MPQADVHEVTLGSILQIRQEPDQRAETVAVGNDGDAVARHADDDAALLHGLVGQLARREDVLESRSRTYW